MSAVVRISVANLATRIFAADTDQCHHFGVVPKSRIQALGGAAELTPEGVDWLQQFFGAHDFETDQATGLTDARFRLDAGCAEEVLSVFKSISGRHNAHPCLREMDPKRDILAELTGKEWPNHGYILEPNTEPLGLAYRGVARQRQPESGKGTSEREVENMPTFRLFRLYDIVTRQAVVDQFLKSPLVRVLTEEDLATTKGGACKGKTADGTEIADNLFLP